MTDTLATKQDLDALGLRMDARFAQVDARIEYIERHLDTRLAEHAARFGQQLAELERRMTMRLGAVTVAAVAVVSALGKLL